MAGTNEQSRASESAEVQAMPAAGLSDDDIACPNCGNLVNSHPKYADIGQCSVCQRSYSLDGSSATPVETRNTRFQDTSCPNCGQALERVQSHNNLAKCVVCGTVSEVSGDQALRLSDVR